MAKSAGNKNVNTYGKRMKHKERLSFSTFFGNVCYF